MPSRNPIAFSGDLVDATTAREILGGISVPTLYRGIKANRFPAPIHLSKNVSRWSRAELTECIERLKAERAA